MSDNSAESLGRQIDLLVSRLMIESATDEEVAELAARICALGRDAIERLAGGILRPGPARREKVAVLLACLRGEEAGWALGRIHGLIASGRLGPTERMWLLATAQRLEEAARPASGDAKGTPGGRESADWGERAAEVLSDETQLLLWRDELASLDPAEQEAVLAPILQSGDPGFLPLLETASSLGKPRLDAAIAGALARFPTQAALPLLREMLRRPDRVVRKKARESLVALERQGVDASEIFVATAETDEPIAAALATPVDRAGQMAVMVARGTRPGPLRYAVVVLDLIEAGIARAWGETGLTEADLHERIAELSAKGAPRLVPTDPNMAQTLVAAGEAYARARGQELPPDHLIWRRCIGRPRSPTLPAVEFGPSCSECRARMRRADIERGGLVVGPTALCAKCAERARRCVFCGRSLHRLFDEFFVRGVGRDGKVEFVCVRCARSRT